MEISEADKDNVRRAAREACRRARADEAETAATAREIERQIADLEQK